MKKNSLKKISTTYSGQVQAKTILIQDFNERSKKEKNINSLKLRFLNKRKRKDAKLNKLRKNKKIKNMMKKSRN